MFAIFLRFLVVLVVLALIGLTVESVRARLREISWREAKVMFWTIFVIYWLISIVVTWRTYGD